MYTTKPRGVILGLCALALAIGHAAAQPPPKPPLLSTAAWCADSGTYCWNPTRKFLSGIRVVGEPKFGEVISGGDNRVESEGLGGLGIFAFETNLLSGWLSFQAGVITPGRVSLDEQSALVTSGRLIGTDRQIDVDFGLAVGLSVFEGILILGYGYLNFDERDIINPTNPEKRETYVYINLQPISLVRAFFKQVKD